MILDLLPLLKGWSYSPKDVDTPFIIPAGREYVIEEVKFSGYPLGMICSFDNPYTELVVESTDSYGAKTVTTSQPYLLYKSGFIGANPSGYWIAKYSDAEKFYTICYTPSLLIPFIKGYKALIRAPKDSNVTVYGYFHLLLLITDEVLFRKSLRELELWK